MRSKQLQVPARMRQGERSGFHKLSKSIRDARLAFGADIFGKIFTTIDKIENKINEDIQFNCAASAGDEIGLNIPLIPEK